MSDYTQIDFSNYSFIFLNYEIISSLKVYKRK